MMYFSL